MVENLVRGAVETTLVELQDQVLPPFDKEMTSPLCDTLRNHRVSLLLGDSAEAFEPCDQGIIVRLKSGKQVFEPVTGRIHGAQAVRDDGVDKRIDVLAVAIQAGMTVLDLEETELAYSPQFCSAKDPVNMAGFVAANLVRGDHPQIDVATWLAIKPAHAPWVLDVRTAEKFGAGNLPGAINIPVDELRSRLQELPRDRDIVADAWYDFAEKDKENERAIRRHAFDQYLRVRPRLHRYANSAAGAAQSPEPQRWI
jgi:hypothetical protein